MEAGLDSLKWSCNVADEKQFEQLIRTPTVFFDLVKENIKNAWEIREKNKYKTKLYASSVKYNNEQIWRMGSFLKENVLPYVDEFYWLPLYTAGGLAKKQEKELDFKPIAGNTGRLDDPAEPLPCWTLFTEAHIMSDGRMTACCLDGTGNWVMGDLKNQSFMEIWHSKEYKELRKAHLNKNIIGTKCEQCALIK
jgi:radical SAM protein with 4Fe4S-binding SPASM domain